MLNVPDSLVPLMPREAGASNQCQARLEAEICQTRRGIPACEDTTCAGESTKTIPNQSELTDAWGRVGPHDDFIRHDSRVGAHESAFRRRAEGYSFREGYHQMPGPTKGTARAWLPNEIVLQSGINVLEDMCADVRRIKPACRTKHLPCAQSGCTPVQPKSFSCRCTADPSCGHRCTKDTAEIRASSFGSILLSPPP